MPIFATIADMQARIAQHDLVQLTDDDATGEMDAARVEQALVQADNEINGYVAAYYKRVDASLPVPPLLTDLACDLAHYHLFRHGSPTERVQKRYEAAVAKLRDIARGIVKIDQGEKTFEERPAQILVDSSERLFTRNSMRDL